MGLKKSFKTDAAKEKKGHWVEYANDRVLISRAGGSNTKFEQRMSELVRPHAREIDLGNPDRALLSDITQQVFAEVIIMAWETRHEGKMVSGIDPVDMGLAPGKPKPCNFDNIMKVFRYMPDLFIELQEQSQVRSNYKTGDDEVVAGN